MVLRSRAASPLFFLLNQSEVSKASKLIKAVFPSVVQKRQLQGAPSFKADYPRNRRRLALTPQIRLNVAAIQFNPDRRDVRSDQFLVDAFLSGGKTLREFLARQESDATKPYWTPEYSRARVSAVKSLLTAPPENFVILVGLTDQEDLIVLDGHHRVRVAQLGGCAEIAAVLGIPGVPTVDWDNPRLFFLNKLINQKTVPGPLPAEARVKSPSSPA